MTKWNIALWVVIGGILFLNLRFFFWQIIARWDIWEWLGQPKELPLPMNAGPEFYSKYQPLLLEALEQNAVGIKQLLDAEIEAVAQGDSDARKHKQRTQRAIRDYRRHARSLKAYRIKAIPFRLAGINLVKSA